MDNTASALKRIFKSIKEKDLFDLLHDNDCTYHDEVVIGEPGTGSWDTQLAPGPCNCGIEEVLKIASDLP